MNQKKDSFQKSRRNTAKCAYINDINNGTFIKRTGWDPSSVLTKYGEYFRVNLMGVVVSMQPDENSFLIDDGTGNIQIRLFESTDRLNKIKLGDLVNVIGKPREWSNSKYLVPDIIRSVSEKKWFEIHKLNIVLKNKPVDLPVEQDEEIETGPYQQILNLVAVLDKGEGASVQEIIENSRLNEVETIVNNLMAEGEIFEVSPGKIKLLS